jgi:hypothetical protein
MGNAIMMFIKHRNNQLYPVKNIFLLP